MCPRLPGTRANHAHRPLSPLFLRLTSWHVRAFKSVFSCFTLSVSADRSGTQVRSENSALTVASASEFLVLRRPTKPRLGPAPHTAHAHTSSQYPVRELRCTLRMLTPPARAQGNLSLTCFESLLPLLYCALQRSHLLAQASAWKGTVQHQGPAFTHSLQHTPETRASHLPAVPACDPPPPLSEN